MQIMKWPTMWKSPTFLITASSDLIIIIPLLSKGATLSKVA